MFYNSAMLRARPLVPLAAGFVAGIAASRGLEGLWIPFLGLALLGTALIIRWRHPLLLALLGFALGGLRQEASRGREREPLRDRIEGIVAGPPRIYRSLDDPDSGPAADGSFRVGRVQVRFYRQDLPLIGGERVAVRGPMHRPRHATNPGQFDYAGWLERQGLDAIMTMETLDVLEGPPFWSRSRAWFRSLFDRGVRPEVGAFLSAIVLGRREAVADDLVANLQRSGTAHLLAISGQNLVIVMVSLWFLLTLLGIHGRPQTLLLVALLGLYTLLTGLQVSVVRSFLMMATFFGADLVWRRRDAPSALGAAALAITVIDPAQVADVGFQLSFLAVTGLAAIAPVFHAFTGTGRWLWNRLRLGLGVSLAAWLATAPVVLQDFNLLTPGIVLANLLLVPLLSAEFVVGLIHLVLSPLGAGAVSGTAASLLYDAIRAASAAITSVPFTYRYAPPPGPLLMAVYYAGLIAWTAWCRLTPGRWWKTAAVVLVTLTLGLTGLRHRAPEGVLLAVLDVGRGSCAYLEWPDGRNLMVDCGSLDARDAGSSIAAKYLWHRGVTRLDTLVLTHTDADHVNGARSVLDLMRVRRVVVTRAFDGWTWPEGVEVVRVERRGDPVRLGDLEILGPPVWEKFLPAVPPNEASLVLRAGGVLFPGDIEDMGVEELLTLPDLRARVLVMPHHGKYFRRHEELLRRVAPGHVVVSAPPRYYSPRVMETLPVPPAITGHEGAIEITLR
jgi:competence protein ComEC